jgi:hypothetical protein
MRSSVRAVVKAIGANDQGLPVCLHFDGDEYWIESDEIATHTPAPGFKVGDVVRRIGGGSLIEVVASIGGVLGLGRRRRLPYLRLPRPLRACRLTIDERQTGIAAQMCIAQASCRIGNNPLENLDSWKEMRLEFPSAGFGFPAGWLGFPSGWFGFPSVRLGFPSVRLRNRSSQPSGASGVAPGCRSPLGRAPPCRPGSA